MTKLLLVLFGIILPKFLFSQDVGISFETTSSLEQILQKAKIENKFIFLDCYTSWCGPCKAMEKNVYSDKTVGDFYNKNFINIKVQGDRKELENSFNKNWSISEKQILKNYFVDAYPTFIFLDTNGVAVHRGVGFLPAGEFITLGKNAFNPEKQNFKKEVLDKYFDSISFKLHLKEFHDGNRDGITLRKLTATANYLQDFGLAEKIATAFLATLTTADSIAKDSANIDFLIQYSFLPEAKKAVNLYFSSLNTAKLFNKTNINLLFRFTNSTNDPKFNFFYKNLNKINEIMGSNYNKAKSFYGRKSFGDMIVEDAIIEGQIKPMLTSQTIPNTNANWDSIKMLLSDEYDTCIIENTIREAKIAWYEQTRNNEQFAKALLERLENSLGHKDNGPTPLNSDAWNIFLNSADRTILDKTIYWMKMGLERWPSLNNSQNTLDTYANLLYKAGNINDALDWQQKAVRLCKTQNGVANDEIVKNFEKMKNGKPTW